MFKKGDILRFSKEGLKYWKDSEDFRVLFIEDNKDKEFQFSGVAILDVNTLTSKIIITDYIRKYFEIDTSILREEE